MSTELIVPIDCLMLTPNVPHDVYDLLLSVATQTNDFLAPLSLSLPIATSIPQFTCCRQDEQLIIVNDVIPFLALQNAPNENQLSVCVTVLDESVTQSVITQQYLYSIYHLLSLQFLNTTKYASCACKLINCVESQQSHSKLHSIRAIARALGIDPALLRKSPLVSAFQTGEKR